MTELLSPKPRINPFFSFNRLSIITDCLTGDLQSVQNALRVLLEFTQHPQAAQQGGAILSVTYRVFSSPASLDENVRTYSITILNSMLRNIIAHIHGPANQINMLDSVLPSFIQKMKCALVMSKNVTCFPFKNEILKVFTFMVCVMPQFIKYDIKSILQTLCMLLHETSGVYVTIIVNGEERIMGGKGGKWLKLSACELPENIYYLQT